MVFAAGCASLTDNGETIIQVQATQNPAKAQRLTLVGVRAMHNGNIDHAVEKLMQAIEADEAYGPAHNNLGLLHYEQGNLYQAVLAFEQAMELMPYDPIVYYNLGLTLEAAGKVHEAMDLYWQAIEMDPTNPNYLGNLCRLRVRLGETGPDLVAQLQDLILIETRPDWRRWADRQLALDLNDALDRGPKTPEFNTGGDRRDGKERERADNVIDLTPTNGSSDFDEEESRLPSPRNRPPQPELIPSPAFQPPSIRRKQLPDRDQPLDPMQLPLQDEGSFDSLPPSINVSQQETLKDYFR